MPLNAEEAGALAAACTALGYGLKVIPAWLRRRSQAEHDRVEAERATKRDIAEATQEFAETLIDVERDLRRELSAQQAQITQLFRENLALGRENSKQQDEIAALREENATLREALATAAADRDRLEDEITALRAELAALRQENGHAHE